MPDDLSQLKAAASKASQCKSEPEKVASLKRAFELFSEETARLEKDYEKLKKDFKGVNDELASANAKLIQKVRELDVIADYLKNILANMSQGIIFINLSGTITTFNRAAETILGLPAMEALFRPYEDSFGDELFGFSIRQAIQEGKQPPSPLQIVRGKPPEVQEIEVDARLVAKGEKITAPTTRDEYLDYTQGLIILVRDVTVMRQLMHQAQRNDRLKELGEMAAMVAHEIRNPLGGIKGFASLLQRDLKDQPHLQQMATYIAEGTDSLNRLVTNVLNYSRPVNLKLERVDLVPLMLDLLYNVRMDPKLSLNIEYTLKADVDSIMARVDTHQVRAAVLNVVVNAVQAMPEGGEITFGISREGKHAVLEISDTGVGIAEENLIKIFSPFYTTKPEGSGFGLTEVSKIVQAHDGNIEVKSEVGHGSTFMIKIPAE